MKLLSRSILIMLLVDLATIFGTTFFWCINLGFKAELSAVAIGLSIFSGISILYLKENYKIREFNITFKNTYLLLEGVLLSQLIPLFFLALTSEASVACGKFYIFNVSSIFFILEIYRIFFHKYLKYIKRHKKVLILGTNDKAKIITDEINNKQALKMDVVGYIENTGIESDLNILSDPANILDVIKKEKIDIVIMADAEVMARIPVEIPRNVLMYGFYDMYEMITGKFFIDDVNVEDLCHDFLNKNSLAYDVGKRIFDIISSLIILTVTFPILLVIGIKVKKIDGGAAIYSQNRVGQAGKVFKAYKLRTMYLNDYVPTSENLANADKQETDNRVIPFCKFVRKARFDEIPQMINILKGEMSIVGPRAEWDDLVKVYSKEIPYHNCRHLVKSGWTGWAQINQGHLFSADSEAEKLQYDLYYIKHRHLLLEIGILVKAVFLALGGRHA